MALCALALTAFRVNGFSVHAELLQPLEDCKDCFIQTHSKKALSIPSKGSNAWTFFLATLEQLKNLSVNTLSGQINDLEVRTAHCI